jgi:hypothetical protein
MTLSKNDVIRPSNLMELRWLPHDAVGASAEMQLDQTIQRWGERIDTPGSPRPDTLEHGNNAEPLAK